jgi:SsrA-binding protein
MSIHNRQASFNYEIIRTETAGIVLQGSEVKQLKSGKASLVDAFCYFDGDELFVRDFNINETKTAYSHDPKRVKKLLLNRTELTKLKRDQDKHLTIVPLKVFMSESRIFKMEIALVRGKKSHNKKESIKERDIKRETQREIGNNY